MRQRADVEEHKIMAMDAKKRERLLNAAMAEFCAGYKRASTDAIVRKAGISKGLLFHYFGTKANLYDFLVRYAYETLRGEYVGLLNTGQSDLLERLWQLTLLKRDLVHRHPLLFEFAVKAYAQAREAPGGELAAMLSALRAEAVAALFAGVDASQFREGVDVKLAVNAIFWTLQGYSASKIEMGKDARTYQQEYDQYLGDVEAYFALFRKCFYKQSQ